MATEQVQTWIQNDCRLSKIVQSFETDFSNGYLFGEILKQYQYVDDLSIFSKKTNKEAKVKNFQQVEAVLRKLKVKFDAKLINQIMNEERGASLRLLYQIKLGIQKDNPQEFQMQIQASKTMTGLDRQQINRKLEEVLQLKTTLPNTANYQTINKSKKLEIVEKTLLKFEHTKKLQDDKAYQDQKAEESLIKRLYQDQRQTSMQKMSENKQFMQEWQQEGKKNWKQNQDKRADTMARQKHFEDLEVKAYKDKLNKELDEATRDMMGGISEFENNLQKLGIEKNTNIEDALKRMEEKKGIPPGQIQNFSYAATMNKIKENKNLQDFAAKERDRRRRKMIVDQSRTQNNLDKKKNEEQLIQKLMKKQSEEQQFAYLEWRNQQCKQLVIRNREEKALQFEEKKKEQMQELERKRNEEHAAMIENHKKQLYEQKKFYRDVRREEKLERRKLNIEICSEVIDLLLDVANEAYEKTQKRDKRKLEKPEWRDWMEIFKQGKLLSTVVGDNANNLSLTLNEDEMTRDHQQTYDPLQDNNKKIQEVLDDMKNDPAYEDLLQYLSVTGMFNLNTGDFTFEWNQMKEVNLLEGLNLNFQFLDSLIPQSNPILGYNIRNLLENLFSQNVKEVEKDQEDSISMYKDSSAELSKKESVKEAQQIQGLPAHLNLKLCILGRKYGGKRTLAKQIADYYPAGKVKTFQMNDMIKECYDYVCPPKPVAADLDKKKAAPKKAAEESVPVDIFAGLDTVEYKHIGMKLKEKLGDNFDFVQALNQPQDLQSLINDDILLVQLFGEKLKLSYPNKQGGIDQDQLMQNINREQEIQEQLKEIEEQNLAGGNLPDKKGGKASAPKGKAAAPSNEEQLRLELDQIQKVQVEGWILLDFPRTLNQAKTMERLFVNYVPLTDRQKSQDIAANERLQKLIGSSLSTSASSFNSSVSTDYLQGSANAYQFLSTEEQECLRRSLNRKIDPTTGTIYHLEDSPPPENDNKLRDRLQDYNDPDAEHSRLSHQHHIFQQNSDILKQFYERFCTFADISHSDDNAVVPAVNSMIEIEIRQGMKKQDSFEAAYKEVERLVSVKQAEFEHQKKVMKEKMEEIEKERQRQAIIEQQQQQQQEQEQSVEDQQELQHEDDADIQTNNQSYNADTQEQLTINKQQLSVKGNSQQSQRLRSQMKERAPEPLSVKQKQDVWILFEETYYKECMTVFKTIRRQKDLVFDGLIDIQNRYLEFLNRGDQKTQKIHDFIESFNKFSEEFPDLRQDEQTKDELLKRVYNLNNDLWAITETRRDEALEEHQRIINNGWIQHEMRKLIRNSVSIIQNEINKYNAIYKIQVGFQPQSVIQVDQLFNSLVDQGIEPFDKSGKSALLQKIITSIVKLMQYQQDSLSNLDSQTHQEPLKIELQNLLFRLNMISTWITLRLKEFYNYSQIVYETIDDWVSVAVAEENIQIKRVIERLTSAVNESQMRLEYHNFNMESVDVSTKVEIVRYEPAKQSIINAHVDNTHRSFRIEDLEEMYAKMKSMADGQYLDAQTFLHVIVQALQENKVPLRWRSFEFNQFNNLVKAFKIEPIGQSSSMNQNIYSSRDQDDQYTGSQSREFVNWKKALSSFALLTVDWSKLTYDNQNEIQEMLMSSADERQQITLESFFKINQFFENTNDMPDLKQPSLNNNSELFDDEDDYGDEQYQRDLRNQIDLERLQRVKTLLFNLNMNNTKVLNVNKYMNLIDWISKLVQNQNQNQNNLFHSLFYDQ